jgi:hypothetical protein
MSHTPNKRPPSPLGNEIFMWVFSVIVAFGVALLLWATFF